MRVDPEPNPPEPSTILGDWYANLLHFGKRQLILCVAEKTLLPVLLPAVDAKMLPRRLPETVFDVLKALGISWSAIDREMREMQEVVVGRTANRSVLGIVNEFAFAMNEIAPIPWTRELCRQRSIAQVGFGLIRGSVVVE